MRNVDIVTKVDSLLKKFIVNVNQIQRNSDNGFEDIKNEAVLVVIEFYNQIQRDPRIFINELKKRTLRFNKYNRRIESKERWEQFNQYEEVLPELLESVYVIDEDILCNLIDIQCIIDKERYEFLIDYYSLGADMLAEKQNTSPSNIRRKVKKLIDFIKENIER